MRLLALFDRPEDDLLLCAGTLARYAQQGADLLVVSSQADSDDRLPSVVRQLGMAHLVNLGKVGPDDDPVALDDLLADLLRSSTPDVVINPAPDPGVQPGPAEILRAASCSSFFRLLESGELRGSKLYHRAMPASHLNKAVRLLQARGLPVASLPLGSATTPDARVTSIIEVGEQLHSKLGAMRMLAQLPELSADDAALLFGREFFSRAHPYAWVTGVIERDLVQGVAAISSLPGRLAA